MADSIFFNGNILSFHNGLIEAKAVAVRGGKIAAVGTREAIFKWKNTDTQLIDLQGNTLLPGFADAHIHVWKVGNLLTHMLDLRGVKSIPEIQQRLREFCQKRPNLTWVNARGFNEVNMLEKRLPTRADLDEAVPNLPVFLQRTCAHIAVANSKALAMSHLNAQSPDPSGGQLDRDTAGNLTGVLRETAQGLVLNALPHYTAAELRDMVLAAQNALLAQGITTATDPAVTPDLFEVYKKMAADGDLRMRIRAFPILLPDGGTEPLPLPTRYESAHFSARTVKFFSDGGLSGRTAALSRPYLPAFAEQTAPERGILRLDERQFFQLAQKAAAEGWGIATHAIGDRAIGLVIRVYKKLRARFPACPLRIEHLGLPTRRHLADLHAYNIGVATQPVFLDELGGNFTRYLDGAFLRRTYPVRSLLERGIRTAFSSDAPVVRDFNPMKSVACAVLRQNAAGEKIAPQESVGIAEGLTAFTVGAADLNGDAGFSGAMLPGLAADFVLLDRNPLGLAPADLISIAVLSTWVGGVSVSPSF